MKVRSEDILKPGAKLETKLIDFNDPEVKNIMNQHNIEADELRKIKVIRIDGGRSSIIAPRIEPNMWTPIKLFKNGDEWFESDTNWFKGKLIQGRRLIHFKDGKIIGAAKINRVK